MPGLKYNSISVPRAGRFSPKYFLNEKNVTSDLAEKQSMAGSTINRYVVSLNHSPQSITWNVKASNSEME